MSSLRDQIIDQTGEEPDELLREAFASPGWRMVALPALHLHMRVIEGKLARGLRLPEDEVRRLQHRYALLTDIVDRPSEFFSPDALGQ